MKQSILKILSGLILMSFITTSCLNDETEEFDAPSNASITSFSINDIDIKYKAKVNGKDTTLVKTIVGSQYPFSIDQNAGLIYNTDSLPLGTNVSKVTVNISADTQGIFIVAENDSLWESTDSLNFEKPIQFRVGAMDGSFGKTYTATINVHQQEPDSLVWTKMETNFPKGITLQKAIYHNQQTFVFVEQDTQIAFTSSNNGKEWTALQEINIPIKADYSSAISWQGHIYILAEDKIYKSIDGQMWEKVETEQTISKLIACIDNASSPKLIGANKENVYIESTDGANWQTYKELPANFPLDTYSFATYPLDTNPEILRVIVMGQEEYTALNSIAWTQLSEEHEWTSLEYENNDYACPNLRKPTLIHYNNYLYAFGGPGRLNEAFDYLYVSKDNGINWEKITSLAMFPIEFGNTYRQNGGSYSCIVDANNFIWIMWGNGDVWRGRINKLGFINQQ